ncbi:MAG: hypothetical protein ACYCTH_11085 [Cellulomonas sp.]
MFDQRAFLPDAGTPPVLTCSWPVFLSLHDDVADTAHLHVVREARFWWSAPHRQPDVISCRRAGPPPCAAAELAGLAAGHHLPN